MAWEEMPIGEAAKQSGVKVPTIRYYEQIGLLPAPPRSRGNRRLYDAADLRRLAFIRHARELGFDVEGIRTLLSPPGRPQPVLCRGRRHRPRPLGRGRPTHHQPDGAKGRA